MAADERVHIWYYDRQGGIQSYGVDIIKNLPHFFVLLLALQRLDLEGWGIAKDLSFNTDSRSSAQLEVTLHKPAGSLEGPLREPTARIEFTHDRVLRTNWGLVGRATTVYECELTDHPPKEQVVKLSWPEVSRALEPEILKELGEIPDEGVKGHVPDLLASQIPAMMDTQLIRKRLGTILQPHIPESRGPRRLVITVCQKLFPVWDLTPDGFFDVWMQCLFCMLDISVLGARLTRFRSHHSVGERFSPPRYQSGEYDVLPRRKQCRWCPQ
jgi:hypothetical protein